MSMNTVREPAVLGGEPLFPDGLPLARPALDDPESAIRRLRGVLGGNSFTNASLVAELESRVAEELGVRHCIAVSSCTAGLMLVIRASGLSGDVIVPSFTFSATAHAVHWNGLRPVFCEIDASTLTVDPAEVERLVGVRTSAILATHVFGTPCDTAALEAVARDNGLRLFFDAAHAFGSVHAGRRVGGFGDAEVFSLSPTKILIAGEGGLVTTDDDVLAERIRYGLNYGNPGDYDCRFVGLNARMSELHAAVALASLEGVEGRVAARNEIAGWYVRALAQLDCVSLPSVPEGDITTYKDFTVMVDTEACGLTTAQIARALEAEGIETRRYYSPPVHRQRAYAYLNGSRPDLPVTDRVAARVLTLPLWVGMSEDDVASVIFALERIFASADRIRAASGGGG